jgi:hypothetical protein
MFSGDSAKAKELIDRYVRHLTSTDAPLDRYPILDRLRKPIAEQRRADIDRLVQSEIGMSFEKFLSLKESFPPQFREDLLSRIISSASYVHLIIAGWIGSIGEYVPRIYSSFDDGSLIEQEAVTAIGCGWVAALASLNRRKYSRDLDLHEAVYYVYEAKRASEGIDGVGPETNIIVLSPIESSDVCPMRSIGTDGLRILKKHEAKFGIRPFRKTASLELLPFAEANQEWRGKNYLSDPTKSPSIASGIAATPTDEPHNHRVQK